MQNFVKICLMVLEILHFLDFYDGRRCGLIIIRLNTRYGNVYGNVGTVLGMRLAEQEMRLLIMKLLQNFRLDWPTAEPELRQQYVMLLKPDRPARIQFTPRH